MTIKFDPIDCPVCSGTLDRIDVPRVNLHKCRVCGELVQDVGPRPGGGSILMPIGQALERNALGDDRVRAAISAPVVSSVKSFLDVVDASRRMADLATAEATGALRTVLARLENRLDHAISSLAGLDMISDQVGEALASIREARELASTLPTRQRGVPQKDNDASTPE